MNPSYPTHGQRLRCLVQRQIGHDLSALPPAQLRERLDQALAG